MNQRKVAYNIIYKTISDSSYTNLLKRKELDKLEAVQRPFVNNVINGVLKNYEYLEFNLLEHVNKCNIRNKIILIMALYEIFYLKKERFAVTNEYVKLAENEYEKGFINSVLRNFDELVASKDEHINKNLPSWIYNLLSKQYSKDELSLILDNYSRIPKVYYHINSRKCDINSLDDITKINEKIFISDKNILNSDEFKNGYFYVQDINASKLVDELSINENDRFIDICSAPGSKLFNALDIVKEENAFANDLYENRVNLIKEKASILGYNNINYLNIDATEIDKHLDIKFDKILLDVPCSGLGVIGRKPDIKFHIRPESLDELQDIQAKILESASKLLKDNGLLLYSTCTLNKKENRKQIEKFLKSHDNFIIIKDNTIINLEGDMFYHCLIKKVI